MLREEGEKGTGNNPFGQDFLFGDLLSALLTDYGNERIDLCKIEDNGSARARAMCKS